MSTTPEREYIESVITTYMQLYPRILRRRPEKIIYLEDTMIIGPTGNLVLGATIPPPSLSSAPHALDHSHCCDLNRSASSTVGCGCGAGAGNGTTAATAATIILPYYGLNEEVIVHELLHYNGVYSEILTRILTRLLIRYHQLMKMIRQTVS